MTALLLATLGRVLCALGAHRWLTMARWDLGAKMWVDLSSERCTRCGKRRWRK